MVLAAGGAALGDARASRAAGRRRPRRRPRARRTHRGGRSIASQVTSGPTGPSSRAISSLRRGSPLMFTSRRRGGQRWTELHRQERRAACGERRAGSCRGLRALVFRRSARTSIGHFVERERHEHGALVLRQRALNRVRYGPQRLRLVEQLVSGGPGVGDHRPGVVLERDLLALPGSPSCLHSRLQENELVGPRREAAFATEAVELGENGHHGVVGRLHGQIVQLAIGHVRKRGAAPAELEVRAAQQQSVQLGARPRPSGCGAPQGGQPLLRIARRSPPITRAVHRSPSIEPAIPALRCDRYAHRSSFAPSRLGFLPRGRSRR